MGIASRTFIAILAAVASMLAVPAFAQNDGDNPLNEIFRGLRDANRGIQDAIRESSTPQRRVPFASSEIQLSFAPLVAEAAPAVVNVYAARRVQSRSPFAGDPFFEQFFGDQFRGSPRVQSSLGSGVMVDSDGLIVTNNHVIAGADEIRIALSDGREFESEIVLRDERSDLAVLRIRDRRERFASLPFGDSDTLMTGDLVLAIGNPFGVGQTVTSGIISATARTRAGISDFGFFIQTDAAVNPGNSGGALLDMQGRLIGINTAIFTRSGGSNGIGFAIPSNMVRAVVAQARGGADAFERPWLGADFQTVTPQIAESLGMSRPTGALVAEVTRGGPADEAGLVPGEVVLAVNNQPVDSPEALGYRLATIGPGNRAALRTLSRGRERIVNVMLQKAPETVPARETTIGGRSPFTGAVVANLSPRLAERLQVRTRDAGVIVIDMRQNAPALRAGIRPGDIVLTVNGRDIRSVEDLVEAAASDQRSWRYTLDRRGQIINQFIRF